METFVCLDANILIRLISQGQAGCEREHWDELTGMVERREVTLLSPQIILMEFTKQIWNSDEDFHLQTARLTQQLKWNEIWNEVRNDLKQSIDAHLVRWRDGTLKDWRIRGEKVRNWLTSEKVTVLPFNQDILFRAKQRLIEGRFPKSKDPKQSEQNKAKGREWERDNDCCIIESLIVYFAGQLSEKQLLFCTENLDDFGFAVKDHNSLDSRLQDGLPPTEIVSDLKSLVQALKESKTVVLPTSEEREQALEEKAAAEAGSVSASIVQHFGFVMNQLRTAIERYKATGIDNALRMVHGDLRGFLKTWDHVLPESMRLRIIELMRDFDLLPELEASGRIVEVFERKYQDFVHFRMMLLFL